MTVRVWDSDSGDCLRILRGHTDRVLACVFSADGRFVASGSSDHTLRVWDLRTAQCVSLLRGHHAGVRSCAFSPDGLRLLSSGEDGTVRVWDIATGRETQFRIYVLNASDYVSLAPDADSLIEVGGNAWRSLGWSAVGPNGRLTRYPAEFAGPLPMGQAVTELLG
jgi:WD40 repeat protein